MTNAEMNLELLRLCHRHDRSPKEVIDRATTLRKFVLSSAATPEEKSVERNKRRTRADKSKDPA